ncbi:MAG: helix-turn-helix domain-containing protein [Thermoanaerobaculia bacterium]|nr:helix-turn-helix domain-containing protein [Thermoanaerobaculia bacterium]
MEKKAREPSGDRRKATLRALGRASVATPDVAGLLGLSKGQAYRICRKLEEEGLLESELGQHPGHYCVDCDTALTSENYQQCEEEGHDIRPLAIKVRIWKLTARGLKAAGL